MIKFKATMIDGDPLFGFGISDANIAKLKDGKPIKVDLKELGEKGHVVILYGPTEMAIHRQMIAAGLINDETEVNIDPRLEEEEEREGKVSYVTVTDAKDLNIIGVNTRYYPSQDSPMDPPAVLCVLAAGGVGDYAAYVGYGSPEFVARSGNKITFEEASAQFPGQLERDHYRGVGGYEDSDVTAFFNKPECNRCGKHLDDEKLDEQGVCGPCIVDDLGLKSKYEETV